MISHPKITRYSPPKHQVYAIYLENQFINELNSSQGFPKNGDRMLYTKNSHMVNKNLLISHGIEWKALPMVVLHR
jgi:hypothetical protein